MKGGVSLPTFFSLKKRKWVATKAKPQNSSSHKVIGLPENQKH